MAITEKNVLWAGRLEEKPDAAAFSFQSSIEVDKRMALEDVRGSRAHAVMLGKQGIITADRAAALDAALAKIARGIEAGAIDLDDDATGVGNGSPFGGGPEGAFLGRIESGTGNDSPFGREEILTPPEGRADTLSPRDPPASPPRQAAQEGDAFTPPEGGADTPSLRDPPASPPRQVEDVHSFVEGLLTEALGDAGRAIHAGRSRNDQVATDFRLYCRRAGDGIRAALKNAIAVLLDRAEEHAETLMAGFTHLQRAQPVTLGHELVAWAAALSRDQGRFSDALTRLNECPLGSGALAGTTLPLDREAVARDLGFARPALNAMDAVADRDFALELAAACAITQTHLSRFCEDVCLWASEEWGFVDLGEKWSTGSSIMPQKKNPDFAELVRGKTGRVNGNLVALLTVMKGLPYAYNKDLQEDKEALFDSLDTVLANLRVFAGFMGAAVFNKEKMEASCAGGFLEATDVAEYLVKKGMPFRTAHECAAHIVRDCIDAGLKRIGEAALPELQKHSALIEADIFAKITPRACVEARSLPGGPAPNEVRRQIAVLRGDALRANG